jgi:hypothetical protein
MFGMGFARANGVPKIFFIWHEKLFSDFQDFSLAIVDEYDIIEAHK